MEQLIKKDRIQKLLADYMFTATKLLKEEKVKQAVEVLKKVIPELRSVSPYKTKYNF